VMLNGWQQFQDAKAAVRLLNPDHDV
jgi:hypothetical protein